MTESHPLSQSGSSSDKETSVSEIKIMSRWDSQNVLYDAEGAADIREALEAARKQDAYLRGANLQGANLQDANLRGAYLRDADLRGADLQVADLRGANLRGAYLQGANLQSADLQSADLQSANLQSANLQGANLGPELWSEVVDILTRALSEISITGHWIKGSPSKTLESGEQAYCAIGAVRKEGEGTALAVASWLLAQVSGGSVESFNDANETTLEDVKAVFGVAIMHARRWAGTAKAAA